ncbi:MAG TPA: hypothetical protein VIQ62_07910 [Burkholderiales bacterium]
MPQYTLPPGHRAASPARRWLQTALAAVAGTGVLVLAFFFAMFALMAAALLVGVVAVRWWWLVRAARRRAPPEDTVVEGEYRVIEHQSSDDPRH